MTVTCGLGLLTPANESGRVVNPREVSTHEYHREQELALENRPLWLAWQCLTHKGTSTSLCTIRGASKEPESCKIQEEAKRLRSFHDPAVWWDNRAQTRNNCPDFKHASAGESLWIGSCCYPKWVHPRLECLEDSSPAPALGWDSRGAYREGEGPRFQSGRSSTKLTEKDGRKTFKNCNEMQQQKVKTNISNLLAALKASSSSRDLERGKKIHASAIETGHDSNIYVASTLVNMYAKCGSMGDARGVFDRMLCHNVVSWTALMVGYAENGEGEVALQLFARMQFEGCAPNARTFVAALKACTSLAAKEEAKQIDGKLVKMGSLLEGMAIHSQAAKSGCDSDIFVASTLVDLYAKCGSMVDARGVFDRMLGHDVVSWGAIILGYAENGEGEVALQLFARMRPEGCTPDVLTFVAALKACGSVAALETGKEIHADLRRCGLESNTVVANSLINFYGKCGSMVVAQQVFDSVSRRGIVTWNSLIAGYSRQGDTKQVFSLYQRMRDEGLHADGFTFLSILTVCSHAGLVDKGKEYFQAMCSKYGISPGIEHYHCMVDILGRANQLDDAVAMVKSMPFKPNVVTWKTVLGACRKWKNVVVGRLAFESLLRLDEKQAAPYVLMANIYGSVGMWEEKSEVHAMRRNAGAWKKPGQSWWTDQAGKVHTFVVGDTSHPQSEEIQAKLKHVLVKMKEQGYVADASSVLRDISDDEKESALCGHSEKLAIACALVNTAPGTTIRIVKNLRVCDDCHKATAIISKIEQRAIICRDASRFHVFKNGKCACGDFW